MKKIIVLLVLSVLFVSCKSGSAAVNKNDSKSESKYIVRDLIENAIDKVGTRYKAGGNNNNGYDCSGLVFSTFQIEKITMPRTSYEQSKIGKVIPLNEARKGDLIFFKTNKSKQINHVGLITEVSSGEVKFVHSSTSKGVIISSTKEPYYQNSFEQVNRVIE